MGKKHGVWFDLSAHLAIHNDVINKFSWLIKDYDNNQYSLLKFQDKGFDKIKHSISFKTTNGFRIDIIKETIISKHSSESAMTVGFAYNCLGLNTDYHLMYHSSHDVTYNPNAPWHDKSHRHEFDGKVKKIDIYSYDHRIEKDQSRRYTWKGRSVNLNFYFTYLK